MTAEELAADTLPPADLAAPACHCMPSVPWSQRRYDGVWEETGLEQRTCRECGASLTIEVTR
jgi:hypothetical protein